MPNPQRFNYRNRGVSEANTKTILASLKNGQKTITELEIVTGLTRQTVVKKLNDNKELIGRSDGRPAIYYLKEIGLQTVIEEEVAKNKEPSKFEATKNAIVHGTSAALTNPVFFPDKTHNDHSIFHDQLINAESDMPMVTFYQAIDSQKKLDAAIHTVKVMYDLLQFRKTLKEFE